MIDLRKLNIKGFHLNTEVIDRMNSIYYDNDENSDDIWIQITNDCCDPDVIIVSITEASEIVMMTSFNSKNIDTLESWLNNISIKNNY